MTSTPATQAEMIDEQARMLAGPLIDYLHRNITLWPKATAPTICSLAMAKIVAYCTEMRESIDPQPNNNQSH